jgi:hypothetical protein
MVSVNLARLASVLLAIVLVVSLTDWALTFSARRTMGESPPMLPAGDFDLAPQVTDLAPIAHLFGALSSSGVGGVRALGVMAEGRSGRGIALIAVDGQPARSVRAGDSIAAGMVLVEVRRDYVVIKRSGTLQEIRLATKPVPPGILRSP